MELAAWRQAVGAQPAEDLPGLAVDALARGVDSPAVTQLAGQSPGDVRGSGDLFEQVLDELAIATPTEQDALWKLVRFTCGEIVTRTVTPLTGAQWIWHSAYHRMEDNGDLRIFVGLASEGEDYGVHQQTHSDDRQEVAARPSAAIGQHLLLPSLRWFRRCHQSRRVRCRVRTAGRRA